MDDLTVRELLSTALGDEPPNGIDTAAALARGRRAAAARRRLAVAAGTLVPIAALVLALVAWPAPGSRPDPSAPQPARSTAPPATTGPAGPVVRTAGCVTATTSPSRVGPDGKPAETGQPTNMAKLSPVAGRLDGAARSQYASVYAGVRLQLERDRVQVFRKPSADFDRWVLREFAADCVEVLDAKYSDVELSARLQQVYNDVTYWGDRGIVIGSMGADFIRGVVEIGVREDIDRARRELPARYGPGVPLEIHKSDRAVFAR